MTAKNTFIRCNFDLFLVSKNCSFLRFFSIDQISVYVHIPYFVYYDGYTFIVYKKVYPSTSDSYTKFFLYIESIKYFWIYIQNYFLYIKKNFYIDLKKNIYKKIILYKKNFYRKFYYIKIYFCVHHMKIFFYKNILYRW